MPQNSTSRVLGQSRTLIATSICRYGLKPYKFFILGYANGVCCGGSMRLKHCFNYHDFRELARRRLPGPIFNYIDGAADDETTYRRNTAAFEECDLLPNVLKGAERVDLSVVVMGQKLQVPFYCSPTALQRLFHHQGERAVARAVQKFGTMFGVLITRHGQSGRDLVQFLVSTSLSILFPQGPRSKQGNAGAGESRRRASHDADRGLRSPAATASVIFVPGSLSRCG